MTPLFVGDCAHRTRSFSPQDLEEYMRLTGDQNPLHTLESGKSRFGAPIVHGMLLAGMVSALIGTQLPGPGSVYVSQELRFIRPVFCGDIITATCRIAQIHPENGQVRLRVQIRNQKEELVLAGYAVVLPP